MESENQERTRELARARAKRYYDNNKAKIYEQKRNKYLEKKAVPEPSPVIESEEINEITKNDILFRKLNSLELNPHTKRKYLGDFKRLLAIVNDEPLITCMKDAFSLVEKIKNSDYAENSKKGIIQICLFLITQFSIKINKISLKQLNTYFELTKQNVNKEVDQKRETEIVPTWKEYLDKVKTEFGETSKMYLIARLYQKLTLRDDFVLKIVLKTPKTTDENYLVLNKKNYSIIINQYKTQHKYGAIKVKLTSPLTNLIKSYMELNNLKENDFLLGDKELSSFVLYNNKKINADFGISGFRKMTVTEELSKQMTDEERINLAYEMKHSLLVQRNYLRQLKKNELNEEL